MDTSSPCWLEEADFARLWVLGKCLHMRRHNMHLPVVREAFQMQSAGHQPAKLFKLFFSLSLRKNNETFFKRNGRESHFVFSVSVQGCLHFPCITNIVWK